MRSLAAHRRSSSSKARATGSVPPISYRSWRPTCRPCVSLVIRANFIPRNAPVLADVDDINTHVGFWAPQNDFRIPERLSPGFTDFPDIELEAIYEDQVKTFIRYQTRLAQRAIIANPGADLVMVYIEEPDGSGHQFTLTDPRQATNFLDPNTIGAGQDRAKVRRYNSYLKFAYQQADKAVAELVETVGPETNVFVVSDHGMAPFHTAVSLTNILKKAGVDTASSRYEPQAPPPISTSIARAANRAAPSMRPAYISLVNQVAAALSTARRIPTRSSTIRWRSGACSQPSCAGPSVAPKAKDSVPTRRSARISATCSR